MASTTNVSSIATALAGKTAPLDFPRPAATGDLFGKDSFAAVVARAANGHNTGLPTPPNSISPNLPPQTIKAQPSPEEVAVHVDSDIDLLDAVDHANAQDQPHHGFAVSNGDYGIQENAAHITPAYLAKNHLPGILLQQGPIAIRHVMGHLSQSVPGFAEIPPAKARRLVVGALEGRSNGEIEFEKVGWGRWNARLRGQAPSRDNRAMYPIEEGHLTLPMGSSSLGIPHRNGPRQSRRLSHGSWTAESMISSHSDRMDIEHEADKMSLDGDRPSRPIHIRGAPVTRRTRDVDMSDTDSEDWEKIGLETLRRQSCSYSTSFNSNTRRNSKPRFSPFPKSVPTQAKHPPLDFTGVDPQERAAVEALMAMGSL